jgi:glycosyltransferase involved in cell wall biosynthesis
MAPLFSVFVPVYNGEPFISRALDCLLGQTDPDWEAVVVDDGSTDETPSIVEAYAAKDSRIKVFRQDNSGAAVAARLAFEKSSGRWMLNLPADDLFAANKLAIHREWFKKHPDCRFFYTHCWFFSDDGQRLETDYLAPIPEPRWQVVMTLASNLIHANSTCIERHAFQAADGYDSAFPFNSDYDLWLRLLSRNTAVYIPERTCGTRIHTDAFGVVNKASCLYDAARSGIRFLNEHPFKEIFPLVNLSQADQARAAAEVALQVAANPGAYLYRLGPHPALIWRLFEWAWGDKVGDSVRQMIKEFSVNTAQKFTNTSFGALWQHAAIASHKSRPHFAYTPVDALKSLVVPSYQQWRNADKAAVQELQRYIKGIWQIDLGGEDAH